ncbi:MAG TPA: hypothetical protein VGJ14_04885 [Sporichthyaceae bacterium]
MVRPAISAGAQHTCALTPTGGVLCWGDNTFGQLGNGTTTKSSTPVPVTGLASGVVAISAGSYHTCAVTTAGAVRCWGLDNIGQLGDGVKGTFVTTAVSVPTVPSAVSISAGLGHTCAVTADGAAWCWGADNDGQLGNGSTSTGAIGPTKVAGIPSGVASISAGGVHTCAVTRTGAAQCWGLNNSGQLGNGTSDPSIPVLAPVSVTGLSSGVSMISAGYAHTCAVTTTGAVLCWGYNAFGQVGTTAAGTTAPVVVAGLNGVPMATVSAGYLHTCGVSQAGTAACWGYNGKGQLGNNTITTSAAPVAVIGMAAGVLAISAADVGTDLVNNGLFSCAITSTGGAECWGSNADGQLGDGTTTDEHKPVMSLNYQH